VTEAGLTALSSVHFAIFQYHKLNVEDIAATPTACKLQILKKTKQPVCFEPCHIYLNNQVFSEH
jgi:hypothetical protein